MNLASLVDQTLRFAAEPYESGEILVTTCEPTEDGSVRIVGTVVRGTRTSRLLWATHHQDIAGEVLELPRCGRYEIKHHRFARYVYPV